MAVTNGYCTIRQLAREVGIDNREVDPLDDDLLEPAVNAASRQIDEWCGQRFFQDLTAVDRYFSAVDGVVDLTEGGVGGVSTLTGLIVATDDSQALTYGTTWASTDYRILPLNAAADSEPWTSLIASPVGRYSWPRAEGAVKVTAKFGWASTPDAVERACTIQAAQLYKSKDAVFGVAAFGEQGAMRVRSDIHPIAKGLLAPYRKPAIG